MNPDQAYNILDYGAVPKNREEQIQLIQIMGYTGLRGGKLLPNCPDRQLRQVAQRLFKKAEDTVHAALCAELKAIREEEEIAHYRTFLYQCLNISEEGESCTIRDLEERIMQ